ncbi:MAG TPA: CCA tRNA nucleotidyltransferase, partial [Paracoccus sp. (in: a-proteobacteria)]|nr:CCA tRNA nucleotidyltransferase [Paracoccus sp. (in: a-proteobacteria)]
LRILRFFRFHARYGRPGGADPAALDACARHARGLGRISRERMGHEMRKLLSAPDPAEAVELMERTGVLAQVLPGARADRLAALVAVEAGAVCPVNGVPSPFVPQDIPTIKNDWPLRLAALGADDAAGALRLSRDEARMQDELYFDGPLAEAAYRLGAPRALQLALLRASRGETLRADWREQIGFAAGQKLPIAAADLMPDLQGPAVGRGLRAAERVWIESGFLMPPPALVDIARLAGKEG